MGISGTQGVGNRNEIQGEGLAALRRLLANDVSGVLFVANQHGHVAVDKVAKILRAAVQHLLAILPQVRIRNGLGIIGSLKSALCIGKRQNHQVTRLTVTSLSCPPPEAPASASEELSSITMVRLMARSSDTSVF